MISMADTALLSWFFGEGIANFERSVFGGQLERAAMYATPWTPRREITARPTAEYVAPAGHEPDHAALARYGLVSRRLGRVAAQDPLAAEILAAFFGDAGAAWARHERGRLCSLFKFTDSGRQLIARARKKAKGVRLEVSDADRLRSEIEVDHVQPRTDPTRRRLITLATEQAQALYHRAAKAWTQSKAPCH